MKQRDMVMYFCRNGISDNMFWLGAVEKANAVNGLTYNGHHWMVYYRENAQLSNVSEFAIQEEACEELYKRVMSIAYKS